MSAFTRRMASALAHTIARNAPVSFTLDDVGPFTGDAGERAQDSKLRREGGGDLDITDTWLVVSKTSMSQEPRIGAQLKVVKSEADHMPEGLALEVSHVAQDEIAWKLFLVEPATE